MIGRIALLSLIYLYSACGMADQLFIQSRAITDLYGSVFLDKMDAKNVVFLERQAKPTEVQHAVTEYATSHKYDKLTVIGQRQNLEGTYVPVLTQFELPKFLSGMPIYLLQGRSRLEHDRKAIFEQLKPEEFEIKTDYDLRKALVAIRKKPPGFLVINVFSLTDSWGDKRSYKMIEETVLQHRTGQVEVGVCYPGFKTAMAVGPTVDPIDVGQVIAGGKSQSICANLDRLRQLDRLDLYSQSAGKFYRVKSHAERD
uniref:Uncharacterized protein n=1 Tax=Pseudomonas phage HRDY3 TaxID=3236930 RepID=A0AB39CDE3_9VIRU